MMSNPPSSPPDPKPTVPIRMDPIVEDPLIEDDLETAHETGKERLFGYFKWALFVGAIGAVLYFGGGVVRDFLVSDLEQKIASKDQEIETLKQSIPEIVVPVEFEVVVKQVTSSSRGKAYLVMDSMSQPWFAISGIDFKVSDKALLELKIDAQEKSVQVVLRKIGKGTPKGSSEAGAKSSPHATHSDHSHNDSSHSHEAPQSAHP